MKKHVELSAANEYRQLGVRHEVETASPHRLIQMMMERVLANIARAKASLERGLVAEKGQQISRLQASLNHEPDRTLGSNFDALYDYMSRRLVESNLNNDVGGLEEVADLMRELKSAWDVIGEQLDKPESASRASA